MGTVGSSPTASTVTLEALLDELKLQPDLYHEVKLRAVARCLAARERARDTRRSESDLQIALDRFRRSRDLAQPAATREWMVENEVSLSQLAALAQEDAALSDATAQLEGELDIYLRNELRSRDLYAALAERARDKQHVLGRLGAADASFDQVVIVDFLEHIVDDAGFVQELARIVKPGGRLLINVPHIKPYSLLNRVRNWIGLTDQWHGHLRPGYTVGDLTQLLQPHFVVERAKTYSWRETARITADVYRRVLAA